MPETIGQRLKRTREERYITLVKAAEETRIRSVFLAALEDDDYSALPSAAQGRGFLRNYAEYLNLDIDEIISEMQRNAPPPQEVSGPLPQVNFAETDVPSLTDQADEEPARPFWTSWLVRRPKAESTLEIESSESPLEDLPVQETSPAPVEAAPVKSRGRKKKTIDLEPVPQVEVTEIKPEEASQFIEAERAEPGNEAEVESKKPDLFAKILSAFRIRLVRPNLEKGWFVPSVESSNQKMDTPVSEQPASEIFVEIGRKLRERREMISLTIEEVERHTRMRAVFIKYLEEGAFDKLPSPVQTRGMLANYAEFLDLDSDTILLRFADALLARRREKYSETPREMIQTQAVTSMPFLRAFFAGDLIFGFAIIAIVAALLVWWMGRLVTSQNEQPADAAAPSIVDVLAGGAGTASLPNSTFIPLGDDIAGTAAATQEFPGPGTPTFNPNINVTVGIFAVERAFIRISVDGAVAFEGRISPRETKYFEAENQVEVLTGNAAALRITYNGRDLGLMGSVGEVVSRVYLISGIATPTATISPTPTNTPFVTATPTFTITPTATPESR